MNNTTCYFEHSSQFNDSWCPAIFDKYMCWPSTAPGENITLPCPEHIKGMITGGKAYRLCNADGTWSGSDKNERGYTNYNNCFLPQLLDIMKMCSEIPECPEIIKTTRKIEMTGLFCSYISLIISLFIFFRYRILKNNRTKIHINLFVATLLQVKFRLIKYIDQQTEKRIIENTPYLDETCIALLEYAKTSMFMWMFIEGLYLHNMITVTVFQEYSYIKLYFYIGWTAPLIMTAAWVITMVAVQSSWRFYYFLPYYWILEGPRSTIIVVNLIFLINIIRVLVDKLRESHTSEIEQVRKAVRAAIFLLPLMGIANVFFWVDYRFNEAWKLALWSYTSYFLNTFQGCFVANLYCFLNGEVQAAIKNSLYVFMSLRNHDYTPCRNLTLISTAPEPEPAISNGEGPKWIRYWLKQMKKTPEDRDPDDCDLNGRRTSTIVTSLTLVETKPHTRQTVDSLPRLSNDETDTTIVEEKKIETNV